MTNEERDNVIFIIHSHTRISMKYLASLTDEQLEQLYKERGL